MHGHQGGRGRGTGAKGQEANKYNDQADVLRPLSLRTGGNWKDRREIESGGRRCSLGFSL